MSRPHSTVTVGEQITALLTGFTLTTAARKLVSRFVEADHRPAGEFHRIGKETDCRWEQGEDISLVMPMLGAVSAGRNRAARLRSGPRRRTLSLVNSRNGAGIRDHSHDDQSRETRKSNSQIYSSKIAARDQESPVNLGNRNLCAEALGVELGGF
jgi:hypothetical protein